MARIWIDPPSGWRYGFPKIWDSIESPSLPEWLAGQGYPEPETDWIRCWDVTDENDED